LNNKCDYFNSTWLNFRGKTIEQELGDGWILGVHPDDIESCLEIYANSFRRREHFVLHFRLLNAQQEYRWIRNTGLPNIDCSNIFTGFMGACFDVTEEFNQHIQLNELLKTKEKFFSVVAHDLKNPFNNIIGLSKLLKKNYGRYDTAKETQMIEYIHQSAQTAYSLLSNLLDWSRMQMGRINVHKMPFDIADAINTSIKTVLPQAYSKEVEIIFNIESKIKIVSDPVLLQTVIRNLLTNAVKFSYPKGSVLIEVHQKANIVSIRVSDKGIGISEEVQKDIFSLFNNTTTLGTRSEVGTGLGLSIAKEFVEKLNGSISLTSVVGVGTTFIVELPLLETNEGIGVQIESISYF
jgi:two-component system CheB/CheR fusion protein